MAYTPTSTEPQGEVSQNSSELNTSERSSGADRTKAASGEVSLNKQFVEAYKRLLKANFFATIIVIAIPGVWLLAIFFSRASLPIPFLLLVAMLGTLGAFFSALTRLSPSQNLSIDTFFSYQKFIGDFDGFTFWIYALLRPLTGFIAAIILYLIIMSGMVAGDIFPHFVCHVEDAKGCNHLTSIFDLGPEKAQDYVKALVWGFISGFSERFLPDMLESFANSSQRVQQTASIPNVNNSHKQ